MQIIAIKKNLIQYVFVFEQFPVQTVAIKKNCIQYFLYLNGLQCKTLTIRQMLSIFRFCILIQSVAVKFKKGMVSFKTLRNANLIKKATAILNRVKEW